MSTIVTRAGKGSPLTNTEVDSNFTNLNTDKAELSGATFTGDVASTGFSGDITGAVLFQAKAGEGLTKGDPVYISGISGNQTVVSKADANDANKMPCFGIVDATVSINANCSIVTFGTLADLNTSAFSEGDELYISDTGTLSATAPTGEASQLQKIAKVTRSHASAGSIKVMGAGRTNATPNLDDGKFFLGNSSNQSASATFSTSVTGIALPLSGGVMSGPITTNSTFDGRDVATDGTKLDGIEASATADQTGAQIKTAYEAETNAFTDAQFTKLGGIEASADVTDTTNVTAAGALMDSELTSIASVKALNQGVATGDSPTFVDVTATSLDISGGIDVDGVTNLDVVDIDGAVDMASTLGVTGATTFSSSVNINSASYDNRQVGIDAGGFYIYNVADSRYDLQTSGIGGLTTTPAAGGHAVFNQGGVDADFRVESDGNDHMLFVDGGNNRVGIGTSSPSIKLDVRNDGTNGIAEIGVRGGTDGAGVIQISGHGTTYGSTSFDLIQNSTGAFVQQRADLPLIFATNNTERMRIDSSGQVRLGNSTPTWDTTFSSLVTKGGFLGSQSASYLYSGQNGYYNGGWKYSSTAPATLTEQAAGTHIFYNAASGSAGATISWAERMRIDASGKVSIGASSIAGGSLGINHALTGTYPKASGIGLGATSTAYTVASNGGTVSFTGGAGLYAENTASSGNPTNLVFWTNHAGTPAEAMRIDSSGNVLVGTTDTDPSNNGAGGDAGHAFSSTGYISSARSEGTVALFNRMDSDGDIAAFRKDGAVVGSIGSYAGSHIYIGSTGGVDTHLCFVNGAVRPATAAGDALDNVLDLGDATSRFDDIFATNGTINTSDRNEKQDIEELNTAETAVAVACKGLLRKFRWKDRVAKKGDDARIHFGIIAQDLQAAFEAEGLDAGDYAMFISTTWWESQVEVDAVVAVEAVEFVQAVEASDAVEAVYDAEGELVSEAAEAVLAVEGVEAIEAVEAKDAYTRTDTFDTEAEAPADATERTRLGVRYPELLAFIISAI